MMNIHFETIWCLTGVNVHRVGVEKTEQKPLRPKGRHLKEGSCDRQLGSGQHCFTFLWDQRNSPQREENPWWSRWRRDDLNHICISYCCHSNKWLKPLWLETPPIRYLWRSEIQKLVKWAKIKMPAGLYSFLEVSGENPFCCLFQLLENTSFSILETPAISEIAHR